LERAVLVEHITDATGHTGGEVAPGPAQHDDGTAGHVLRAVVAQPFHHSGSTGVAHAETFTRDAAELGFTAHRAVHHRVTDNDVLLRIATEFGRWLHHDAATGQSLADIVVALADQFERDAVREERAEALSR